MQNNSFKKLIIAGAVLLASTSALATNDGALDNLTSVGDLDISVTIEDQIQISDLDDIVLGTYAGSGALTGSDAVCVYRNGSGNYSMSIDGGNNAGAVDAAGEGAFKLQNADSDEIIYTVKYDSAAMTAATAATGLSGAHTSSPNCSSGTNKIVEVDITEAELQAAKPGAYVGTLWLTVAAE